MTEQEEQKKTRRLRPLQVGASTLAATTGAFLAAQLGVYGTVIGVGVMSLITTIGTEMYIQSLERTRRAARLAARARVARKRAEGTTAGAAATAGEPANGEGRTVDDAKPENAEQDATVTDAETVDAAHGPAAADPNGRAPRSSGRLRWSLVIAGAAVAFVLAMIVVTTFEKVSGSTLSGAEGSTVGNIVTGDTGSGERTPEDQQEQDQPPGPTDEPTEPGTDPTEPAPPPGEEEPEDESDPDTTQSPTEDDTPPPGEDQDIAPPTDEEGDGQTGAPEPREEPEPGPRPGR